MGIDNSDSFNGGHDDLAYMEYWQMTPFHPLQAKARELAELLMDECILDSQGFYTTGIEIIEAALKECWDAGYAEGKEDGHQQCYEGYQREIEGGRS